MSCVCAGRLLQRGHIKVHVPGAGPRRSCSLEPARPGCSGWVRDSFSAVRVYLQFCGQVRTLRFQGLWSLPKRAGSAPKHRQSVSSVHGRSPAAPRSPGGVSRHAASQAQPCWSGQQSHSLLGHEEVRLSEAAYNCCLDAFFPPGTSSKHQLRLKPYFAPLGVVAILFKTRRGDLSVRKLFSAVVVIPTRCSGS